MERSAWYCVAVSLGGIEFGQGIMCKNKTIVWIYDLLQHKHAIHTYSTGLHTCPGHARTLLGSPHKRWYYCKWLKKCSTWYSSFALRFIWVSLHKEKCIELLAVQLNTKSGKKACWGFPQSRWALLPTYSSGRVTAWQMFSLCQQSMQFVTWLLDLSWCFPFLMCVVTYNSFFFPSYSVACQVLTTALCLINDRSSFIW